MSSRHRQGVARHQPPRRHEWATLSNREILALYPAGKTHPLDVLEVLIQLFNKNHTAKQKEVSFKTRRERAEFLRRFFNELRENCDNVGMPDPRNLAHRHIQAVVSRWKKSALAPATIQTYLSFLRGFAIWIGKPGLVRKPAAYGLTQKEYQRHEASNVDKSWSGQGVDIDILLHQITQYDAHIGAILRLIRAFGLRKKEAVMFRPIMCTVVFEETGLTPDDREAERYVLIQAGSKGGRRRYLPINTPERIAAIGLATAIAVYKDAHMGQPGLSLKQVMRRFDYVMEKFGITGKALGVTAHGLRHELLIDEFENKVKSPAPVRGGMRVSKEVDNNARKHVSAVAGHVRKRAANAYIGTYLSVASQVKAPLRKKLP